VRALPPSIGRIGKVDYDEILNLCKDVIPKTWNVYKHSDTDNFKMEKGILNIDLDIYENQKMPSCAEPIRYWEGIANTKINIYSIPKIRSIVLLHELTHVAVYRLESFIRKSHLKSYYEKKIYYNDGSKIESDQHGKIFMSFLNIIENRAIKKGWSPGTTIYENKSVRIYQKS
jgi:hypothetical protein